MSAMAPSTCLSTERFTLSTSSRVSIAPHLLCSLLMLASEPPPLANCEAVTADRRVHLRGSPPRVWGPSVGPVIELAGVRFTPARAGTTNALNLRCRDGHGSPPHAWGRRGLERGPEGLQRFTPTRVGTIPPTSNRASPGRSRGGRHRQQPEAETFPAPDPSDRCLANPLAVGHDQPPLEENVAERHTTRCGTDAGRDSASSDTRIGDVGRGADGDDTEAGCLAFALQPLELLLLPAQLHALAAPALCLGGVAVADAACGVGAQPEHKRSSSAERVVAGRNLLHGGVRKVVRWKA